MNARRVEITLSQERWEQLESARGHEPRAAFIKRALEQKLALVTMSGLPEAPAPPGVKTARELAMERQARLNEAKS